MDPTQDTVKIGTHIEIDLLDRAGNRERLRFDLVSDQYADYETGFLGVSAPIAQAILGEKPGSLIPYFTTELQAIHLLSVTPSKRQPNIDSKTKREGKLQSTLDQIEYRDALLFASSADTKWGSYDADGLDYDGWIQSDDQDKT